MKTKIDKSQNQRLKNFVDQHNIKTAELIEIFSCTRQAVYDLLNGKTSINAEKLDLIEKKYPQIDKSFIMFGAEQEKEDSLTILREIKESVEKQSEMTTTIQKLTAQMEMLIKIMATQQGVKVGNFNSGPLQVGKLLNINNGAFAGDYQLAS